MSFGHISSLISILQTKKEIFHVNCLPGRQFTLMTSLIFSEKR